MEKREQAQAEARAETEIQAQAGAQAEAEIQAQEEAQAEADAPAKAEARKTPLYETHLAAGGKIVDFHGWLLPVQYAGILKEHESVRTKAGMFDVSHMGELEVSGKDARGFLQRMLTNDIDAKPEKAVYSPMCYADGGTVDDLIVYKLKDDEYLLIVNAANTAKDLGWLEENRTGQVNIKDCSADFAQIALQGPESAAVLKLLMTEDPAKIRYYNYESDALVGGMEVMLSRTGYTGEDGFEIYCRPEDAAGLWNMLMDKGIPYGLEPAGLGARDTLRLEAAMPLYGQELSRVISPVMAGLQRFVKPEKGEFNGRSALIEQLGGSLKGRIVGFEMMDRAVPRSGYEVWSNGRRAGQVTSGGYFPTMKKNMGLALIDMAAASVAAAYPIEADSLIEIKVRDALYCARIVELPFYKRNRQKSDRY